MKRLVTFVIAGWSGFFLMSVELLSSRILAPNFGTSIQVWGSIITVFMLALSVGYLLGGRLSVHRPTLKKLSAILLSAAVATAPVALIADSVLDRVFELVLDPRCGSLICAGALFFLPTMIAGMVSPYAVRLLVAESRLCGQGAGSLFFVTTLGSAIGTLATSFYLVLIFDVQQIFWMLIGVSAAFAALALGLSQWVLKESTFGHHLP